MQFGSKVKPFTIELYIRALTTDLNDLERYKTDSNKEKEQAASKRLARGFIKLSEILSDHVGVSSECVLTSFSLNPSRDTLARIEAIAREKGYDVLDTGQWKCGLHPPISVQDEICVECDLCGDFMSKLELVAALNTNLTLNDALTTEQLGISSQLCDDLAVVLCSPRYQFLSWRQKWRDLHRLCTMYLYSPERTKNYVTDLKFLDIDYSIFRRVKAEPVDDEEGLTILSTCEDLMAQEFGGDTFEEVSDSETGQAQFLDVFVPPRATSDPTVLKTLRSYRKGVKRPGSDDLEPTPHEKVFVAPGTPGGRADCFAKDLARSLAIAECERDFYQIWQNSYLLQEVRILQLTM